MLIMYKNTLKISTKYRNYLLQLMIKVGFVIGFHVKLIYKPELQIGGGTEDNSKMIFLISTKTYVVTPH